MTSQGGPSVVRRSAVYALSLTLGTAGAALTLFADGRYTPGQLPVQLPWWALVPAYLVVLQRPLEYEFRQQTRIGTLTQVPMSLGLVFVAPGYHLLARMIAAVCDVLLRRQPAIKATYNSMLAMAELGTAAAIVAVVSQRLEPGPRLWIALLAASLLVEVIGALSITAVLSLVGGRRTLHDVGTGLMNDMGILLALPSLGIIAVAAAWTDPSTIGIIALLAGGLGFAFRRHRRVAQEAQQQSELQQFMKGLGPVNLDQTASREVLEHVRVLLHAEHLDLAVQDGESWRRYTSDGDVPVDPADVRDVTVVKHGTIGRNDHMSTPLLGSHNLVGVLTVRERTGTTRQFGMRDVRMLETVASELAKALERGQLQRELALAATTDPLTGLPNLNETSRLIDAWLAAHPEGLILAAVAVDSFREVNDTLGHEVGDELLLEVTRRLRVSYPQAVIGRIGGGRFAIAMAAESVGGDPSMFGLGVRAQVEGGAQLGPIGTHIRLSVGCVTAREHGDDAATLVRRAETAMYGARHAHGGPVVWEPVYEVEGQRRLAVVMALREALASGAIGVAFQPKVVAGGGAVTGVEALARWTHPALGAIAPAEFVPLAEAAGLMGPLTSTVLRQALTACKGWQRRAGRIGVAVNVSADTVLDPTFVTEVAAILTSINISPDLLTLELTEGVVVNDPALAAERMAEMRALGVKISVDDFGTGYSSLTYLKGLPVDEVKIDKGFVDAIAHDAGDRAVVRAVVDIAHTLGLRVVAEGVEHVEQDLLLEQLGVDEIQGYLYARPMAALDIAQWLRRREDAPRQAAP